MSDHDCDLPSLAFLPYGHEFVCPVCGKKFVKVEERGDSYWEKED